MSIKPLFPYYGSKWNIARHYPAPAHELVVEPFAGSAGYSRGMAARLTQILDSLTPAQARQVLALSVVA